MIKIKFFYITIILFLINCTPPPKPEPALKVIPEPAIMESFTNNKNSFLSPSIKKLEENTANTVIENSTVVVKFLENNLIEEHHQIIFRAENLPSGNYYSSKNFIITLNEGQNIENIINFCEKIEKSEDNPDNNNCEASIIKYEDYYMFLYRFKLFNNEHIKIIYSYDIIKSIPEILYRQESVIIPDYSKGFCDYTFIIPDGYTNLGLEENILKKLSNEIYIYFDKCPSYSLEETIRFTPKESLWKANIEISSELLEGFTGDINITFPKYYHGGKINLSYYRLFSLADIPYKKNDFILDDLYYKIELPSENKQKIGIKLYTAFTNKLSDLFEVNLPKIHYELDESNIDPDIRTKARLIISDDTNYYGYSNYIKLGKFVNSHLLYDEKKISKNYSARELLYLTSGVSSHFTLLYNALLNAIGIPTLTIVGWALKKNEISGTNSMFNHTWTAAYIDNKWIELDATWDLFEGVPAGHILKAFFSDKVYYSFSEKEGITPLCKETSSIQMITNISDLEDPFPKEIEEIIPPIIIDIDKNQKNPIIPYEEKGENITNNNEEEEEKENENINNQGKESINGTIIIDIENNYTDTTEISDIIIINNNSEINKENSTGIESTKIEEKSDVNGSGDNLKIYLFLFFLIFSLYFI